MDDLRHEHARSGAATADLEFSHEDLLDRLAQIAVQVGTNVQAGQQLVVTAPLESYPLVRRITAHAYQAGASLVSTLFADDEVTLLRFRHARDETFDTAADWLQDGIAAAYASGAARLAITGSNPSLLSREDPKKVARANLAHSKAIAPALALITRYETNWAIVSCATPSWAATVFPNEAPDRALALLWEDIFAASRVNVADPMANWRRHVAELGRRVEILNAKRLATLHFRGPGTDLRVGLADDHLWLGGATTARNRVVCVPNLPTEEVFTTPHKDRVDGTVRSTKPLSYQGTVINDIRVRFESGRIVESSASEGEAVLRNMLDSDEGARRLGEVALVPHSSPIAKTGRLFWNTLFDENSASHIALGQSYSNCVRDGDSLDAETLAAKGANASLIHVDWMIGSQEMHVDGIRADGSVEPLMRRGEWV